MRSAISWGFLFSRNPLVLFPNPVLSAVLLWISVSGARFNPGKGL